MAGLGAASRSGHRRDDAGIELAFIDGSVINVARPAMAMDLGGGAEGLSWIINAYLLPLSALLLLGGAAGDQFGRRRVFALLPLLSGEGRRHHSVILEVVTRMVEAGTLRPRVVPRRFSLARVAEAYAAVERGAPDGKAVI